MQSDVEKRRAARRKKIRRRRVKAVLIFFIIIALIVFAVMCFTVLFPIKRIAVTGSKIYDKNEIIKASGLSTDDNLFVVSEDDIENKIRKALPYIDSVKLKRNLPDAVVLTVTDAKEFACYKTDDSYAVVSEKGYVVNIQSECPENVFEIITSGVKANLGEQIIYDNKSEEELVSDIASLLKEKNINIDMIDATSVLDIKIGVEDGFDVSLGTRDYLEEKITHLSGMVKSIGDRRGEINLSMWTPNNTQGSFVENIK